MPPDALTPIQVIQIAVFALLVGGGLTAWAHISIRLASGQAILPAESRRSVPWNLGHIVAIVAVYFLLQAGGALIVHEFFPAPPAAVKFLAGASDKNAAERSDEKKTAEGEPKKNSVDKESTDKKDSAGEDENSSDKAKNGADEEVEPIDPRNMAASLLVHISASILSLIIAVLLLRLTARCTWADLGIVSDKILSDIKLGLVGFAAAAVPIYGLQFVLSHWSTKRHPIINWLEKSPDTGFVFLAAISTMLVAPLAEEFFFRLIFQGWLENIVSYLWPRTGGERKNIEDESQQSPLTATSPSDNPYVAPSESGGILQDAASGDLVPPGGIESWGPIVASAMIFALMHFDHGPAPIPLFFLALLLGYLYQQTHRILPSIVVHSCLNSCSMLILFSELWK